MQKLVLFLFTILVANVTLQAQCPEGDIFLNTQADVNQFALLYPNCEDIVENLFIGTFSLTPSDIDDLSPLSNIKSIGGNFDINNATLTSLEGLEMLTSVVGDLIIINNDALPGNAHFRHGMG